MTHSGVDIKKGVNVQSVEKGDDGIVVTLDNGEVLPPADCLLWAIGRAPNTEGLGCKEIKLTLGKHGHIVVDEFQNTNLGGVYALGDVCGKVG